MFGYRWGMNSGWRWRRRNRRRWGRRFGRDPEKDWDESACTVSSLDDIEEHISNVEYVEDSEEDDPEEKVPPLKVKKVDLNLEANGKAHHTDDYDIMEEGLKEEKYSARNLVVRRGQPFDIDISFNRELNKETDDLSIELTFPDEKEEIPVTEDSLPSFQGPDIKEYMKVSDKDKPGEWGAEFIKIQGNNAVLRIFTPPDCNVGAWSFKVDVVKKKDGETIVVKDERKAKTVYILFNPWNKDDQVYMPLEEHRNEYVMNQTGFIFVGNKYWPTAKPWNFGQFEEDILDCALYLINVAKLKNKFRGDPVKVVRCLSASTNSIDQVGCLQGNWSGDYADGVSPTKWQGSVKILQQYFKSKSSVCYGQCWVFSGLLTTICRALGIPARSVTNFASAHNTDKDDNTIDRYVDEDGVPLEGLCSDSVWNFHVWNESWMTRPDLHKGKHYGGWQAMDATPQERSRGIFQCGPMPVAAIKEGDINEGYDGAFIMAEVNADRVTWTVTKKDNKPCFEKPTITSNSVGKNISTKSLKWERYKGWREDVTSQYKYDEGTPEERAAVARAKVQRGDKRKLHPEVDKVLKFDLVEKDKVLYGKDFKVSVRVTNTSATEKRTIGGCLSVLSISYIGLQPTMIKCQKFRNEVIQPKQCRQFDLEVSSDDCTEEKMKENCPMKMVCSFHVKESKCCFNEEDEFSLDKPDLTMKCKTKNAQVGKPIDVEISFENPLNTSLTDCSITLEGAKVQKNRKIKTGNVYPRQTFMTTVTIVPEKAGKRQLIAGFHSKELYDVKGYCEIDVKG